MRLRDASKILNYDTKKKAVDQKAKLTKEEVKTAPTWQEEVKEPKKSKYLIYLTISTFLFFVTAIAVTYFVRYAGIDRTISTSKITLVTQGAATADSGLETPLTIRIANRNPVSTFDTKLTIIYPNGTYKKEGTTITHLPREEVILEEVKAGEIVSKLITPIFYGKGGEKKNIRYELRYHTSKSAEPKEITEAYEVLLRAAPVLISKPRHTNPIAGKEITFTVEVQSNSTEALPATFVELHYPIGFTPNPKGFSPNPSNIDGTRWDFQNLNPGVKKTITVTGTIRGREGESQAILSRVLLSPTGSFDEAVEIASEEKVLTIGKAFFDVKMRLNGRDTEQIVVSPGDIVRGSIHWVNRDTSKLNNLVITATVTGTGLDESSIDVGDEGYFDEIHKKIIWDQDTLQSLTSLNVGESGSVSFRFKTLPDRIEFAQEQKYVQIHISAQAERIETGSIEEVRNIAIGQINLRSVLQVVANTLYATSVVRNSGPLPPQVGKTTTYALKYFIKNSGNELSNIKIKIPLGRWAELTDVTSGIALTEWEYDEDAHEVTVNIPTLAGSGSQSSRSIELQVSVKPKSRDIDEYITLAERATYTAWDTYVNEKFQGSIKSLDTHITAEETEGTEVVEYQQEIPESEKMINILEAL